MSLDANPLVSDWLTARDGRLVVHTGKVDIGQRITTALVQIAHQELTVPVDDIDVATVRTGGAPDEGITSGSNSIEQSGRAIRQAAATLRRQAVAAVAARYGGVEDDWNLADGMLTGPGTNTALALTGLMDDLDLDVEVDPDLPPLAEVRQAARAPMRGLADMVRGRYVFVHDLDVPGMWHARVVHPPHAKARLVDIPEDAESRVTGSGLHLVRDGSFVAIAGEDEWAVVEAARKLAAACEWTEDETLSEDDIFTRLRTDFAERFMVVEGEPRKTAIVPAPDAPDFAARYERPFTMHAALAPSAAMAVFAEERLTIHTHSQGVYPLRESIADSLRLGVEQVEVIHVPGSGCYGHNGADDAAFEAALVAMSLPGVPILLKWTRADEHAWEPYGTAMAVEIAASLDGSGGIQKVSAEAIGGTHRGRPRPGPDRAGPAKLLANHLRADPIGPMPAAPNLNAHAGMHRNLDPIYAFPEKRLVKNLIRDLPHRTSALRCLGAAANIFALECAVDEIARSTKIDPLDFRLSHLTDARGKVVLRRLTELMGRTPKTEGGGRGIAYAQYKNSMTRVAVCVDLVVDDRAEIDLREALIVADAGRVVDLDGLEAQLEGGFIQGASWALCEEVTWDRDGITSLDWESYPVIRFDRIPRITVEVIDRPSEPSVGAGEAAPGPAIAAIANAVFDATGLRMRRLPMTSEKIVDLALSDERRDGVR